MGGSSFDLIVDELIKQKNLLDQMQEENLELRRQIADLLDGHGIFVDICGTRFALIGELTSSASRVVYALEPVTQDGISNEEVESEVTNVPTQLLAEFTMPTQQLQERDESATASGQETPLPAVDFMAFGDDASVPMPTFLEELMLDEFTSVTANHKAVWTPTEQKSSADKIELDDDEVKKAALRRELIGSFLLE